RPYRARYLQMRPGRAHNDYLNILTDWGIAGALLVAAALGFYVWKAGGEWAKPIRDPSRLTRAGNYCSLIGGGFAGTTALLAHCIVDYEIYAPGVALLLI